MQIKDLQRFVSNSGVTKWSISSTGIFGRSLPGASAAFIVFFILGIQAPWNGSQVMPRTQNSRQAPPTTHVASAPGEVWCWDMTYLPSAVTGQWFYLYLILDLYSRKVIGFEVHERDSSDHAVELLKRVALTEGLHGLPPEQRPVLHARVRHEPLQVLDLHKVA